MPNQEFVVQYSNQTDLYMVHYDPDYSLCRWGSLQDPNLMVWSTLEAANAVATSINHGTGGLPKPKN